MESKETQKKRFYLKWPWNVVVYILLVVLLRVFAIPFILLIMWWNKKQQPDGPEEGYCLQRTRGRLIQLVWAALCLLVSAAGGFYLVFSLKEDRSGWDYMNYLSLAFSGAVAVGGLLGAIYEGYTGLRDALCPEKSRLAQSIRNQLPYPDEAPPVQKLFAMVDQDLKQNGEWFGKLGIGKEWILGDEVSCISRIRGVFSREEIKHHHSGNRTQTTRILQIWILDDRQHTQVTDLKSPKELQGALECLQRRVPAALFGVYDSKEYHDCIRADENQWYAQERAYQQRKAQFEEQQRQYQERQAQNQVLTLPDGSVTSRITARDLEQLLVQCRQNGETRSFQMVPGVPFQSEEGTFSRLVCFPGGVQEPVKLVLEQFSGSPRVPAKYGWTMSASLEEAEDILRTWLEGKVPSLRDWTAVVFTGQSWQEKGKQKVDYLGNKEEK